MSFLLGYLIGESLSNNRCKHKVVPTKTKKKVHIYSIKDFIVNLIADIAIYLLLWAIPTPDSVQTHYFLVLVGVGLLSMFTIMCRYKEIGTKQKYHE